MAVDRVMEDKIKTSQDMMESALALLIIVLVVGGLFYVFLFVVAVVVLLAYIFFKYGKKSGLKRKANRTKK